MLDAALLRFVNLSLISTPNTEIEPMTSLFDQTALADLAERLVAAARRAGADAADAVAVRSMSLSVEIREGAVEESQRSESDDVGLRVLVGRRQSVVSTNDIRADVAQLVGVDHRPHGLHYPFGDVEGEDVDDLAVRRPQHGAGLAVYLT